MKVLPGRNLIGIAAGLLAWSLLTVVWLESAWLAPFVLLVAIVLVISDYRTLSHSMKNVSINRELPAVVGRDVAFQTGLQLDYAGERPVKGRLRDVVPPAAQPRICWDDIRVSDTENTISLTHEFRIRVRGRHEFGPVWLRLRGTFGLLEAQRSFSANAAIRVLPEGFSARERLDRGVAAEPHLLDKLTRSRHHGAGTEFESLSEYREGDDPRLVDWRATARHRHPIVRRFQIERHRDLMILIDCGRLMGSDAEHGTKLDCAVDAALMLSRVALEGGDRCGLGMFDDRVLGYLSPQTGPHAMRVITESVYNLQSQWRESDFSLMFATLQTRQPKRSLVVVLSDIVDEQTSRRFRTSLAMLARRHVVLFAALKTPLLQSIATTSIDRMLDGSRKAVVFRILREREKAIHSLRHTGVHLLDVEPARLTVPLINQFTELRERNLL